MQYALVLNAQLQLFLLQHALALNAFALLALLNERLVLVVVPVLQLALSQATQRWLFQLLIFHLAQLAHALCLNVVAQLAVQPCALALNAFALLAQLNVQLVLVVAPVLRLALLQATLH